MKIKSIELTLLITVFISFPSLSFDYGRSLSALRRARTTSDEAIISGTAMLEMRLFLELSQTDFGALINCSQNMESLMETGKLNISDERKTQIKEIIYPLLSARLVEIREILGLSRRVLADELGISEESLVLLEESKEVISSDVLNTVRELIWPVYAPQRLKRMRQALGMEGKPFALKLGYTDKSTLIRMEEGEVGISLETLKLAEEVYDKQAPVELKKIREMLHFSTEELALGLGMSRYVDIEEMENASRPVPFDILERIRDEIYPIRAREVYITIRSILELSSKDIADYLGCSSFHASNMASIANITAETMFKMNELYIKTSPGILADIREGLGLSKEELAQKLETSSEEIERMEQGEIEIPFLLLEYVEEEIYNPGAPQVLREMRTALDMNQEVLGRAFGGYSQKAISYMEVGQKKVPVMLLKQLRTAYNQSIGQGEEQNDGIALLQKVLDTLGITRTQLAERLSRSVGYIYHLFCGYYPVSQPIRDKLNALLAKTETIQAVEETTPKDLGSTEKVVVPVAEKTPGRILKETEAALADLGVGPENLASELDITLSYLRMMETGMVLVSGDKMEIAQRFLEASKAEKERQDALAAEQETERLEVASAEGSAVVGEETDSEELAPTGEESETELDTGTATKTKAEEAGSTTPAPAASAETKTPAQTLKEIQKQLGLEKNIDEFAGRLNTPVNILRSWTSGMVPVPEKVLRMAQGLLSPQDDPAYLLSFILKNSELTLGEIAFRLKTTAEYLGKILDYQVSPGSKLIEHIRALAERIEIQQQEDQEFLSQHEAFYPEYIYWRWVLEEVMNILVVNTAGFAGALGIEEGSLSRIMHSGGTISDEILIKSENLLDDEQFEILKQRVGQRIADFEAEVRARHREEGDSGG
ncbi:MAG: helix-turn-helix domain-containing protein [Candidatus Omnitrophica bacterium]|nr:helix-turn-helix domain-containing protein [Candidatus Omnitrophota bacterium]